MWCLTCGLDTSVMQEVTAAVAKGRMADAAEIAEKAHLAHDGAHHPDWWPGDPGDDITSVHYHLTIALDTQPGATQMPSGVAVADRCFGDDFHTVIQRLISSVAELGETCSNHILYRQLVRAENDLRDLPEALLAETGFAVTTDFGDGTVVRAALARVEATACTATS